jgi:hypothetical protein
MLRPQVGCGAAQRSAFRARLVAATALQRAHLPSRSGRPLTPSPSSPTPMRRYPERVERLVLVSPVGVPHPPPADRVRYEVPTAAPAHHGRAPWTRTRHGAGVSLLLTLPLQWGSVGCVGVAGALCVRTALQSDVLRHPYPDSGVLRAVVLGGHPSGPGAVRGWVRPRPHRAIRQRAVHWCVSWQWRWCSSAGCRVRGLLVLPICLLVVFLLCSCA